MRRQGSAEGTGWAKVTRAYNLPSRYIPAHGRPHRRAGPVAARARTLAGRLLSILPGFGQPGAEHSFGGFLRHIDRRVRLPARAGGAGRVARHRRLAGRASRRDRFDRPERVQSGRPANLPAPVAGRRNGGSPCLTTMTSSFAVICCVRLNAVLIAAGAGLAVEAGIDYGYEIVRPGFSSMR